MDRSKPTVSASIIFVSGRYRADSFTQGQCAVALPAAAIYFNFQNGLWSLLIGTDDNANASSKVVVDSMTCFLRTDVFGFFPREFQRGPCKPSFGCAFPDGVSQSSGLGTTVFPPQPGLETACQGISALTNNLFHNTFIRLSHLAMRYRWLH